MIDMFQNATLFDQDISGWDVSALELVYGMFESKDNKTIICPKCEAFRKKVLDKNTHLPLEQEKLQF